jgi:hypothetical protein
MDRDTGLRSSENGMDYAIFSKTALLLPDWHVNSAGHHTVQRDRQLPSAQVTSLGRQRVYFEIR